MITLTGDAAGRIIAGRNSQLTRIAGLHMLTVTAPRLDR